MLVRGELRPGGTEREWCDPEVLRRLRRASLAALRKEVEPVDTVRWPASCPPGRTSTATLRRAPGSTGCARRSCRCRGWRCRPMPGSATCCPAASAPTRRRGWISSAPPGRSCGSGRARWAAAPGGWPCTSARTWPSSVRRQLRGATAGSTDQPQHDAVRERLAAGACFFTDLLVDVELAPEELQEALWDLVWAGEATNDAFSPLRAPRLTLARAQRDRARASRRSAGRFASRRRTRRGRPGAGQVVADGAVVRRGGRSGRASPGARRAAARTLRHRSRASRCWPRGSPAASRRSTPSSHSLRRWGRSPGLLRRRARRRAVRAARRGRAAARAGACARGPGGAGGGRPRAALRRGAAVARPAATVRHRGGPRGRPGAYVVCRAATRSCTWSVGAGRCRRWCRRTTRGLQPALEALVDQVRAGAIKRLGAREGRRRAGDDVGAGAGAGGARVPGGSAAADADRLGGRRCLRGTRSPGRRTGSARCSRERAGRDRDAAAAARARSLAAAARGPRRHRGQHSRQAPVPALRRRAGAAFASGHDRRLGRVRAGPARPALALARVDRAALARPRGGRVRRPAARVDDGGRTRFDQRLAALGPDVLAEEFDVASASWRGCARTTRRARSATPCSTSETSRASATSGRPRAAGRRPSIRGGACRRSPTPRRSRSSRRCVRGWRCRRATARAQSGRACTACPGGRAPGAVRRSSRVARATQTGRHTGAPDARDEPDFGASATRGPT